MIVKPLCEYDVSILRYIENTLVMLNEIYHTAKGNRTKTGFLA